MTSKQYININNKNDRIIVLVDMDCFYCQVEEKLNPEQLQGKAIAVVQYNSWQGGGIIAVNYIARAKGVTRHMRGDEAKQHCPEIELPQVPSVRGKADLTKYREAGKEVAAVLQSFTPLLERASVDEAYMDITDRVLDRLREMNEGKFKLTPDKLTSTFAVGYDNIGEFVQKISGSMDSQSESQSLESEEDRLAYKKSDIKLLIGASIVNEIRQAVKDKTGYECSAGIAHNKILAKLTAGFHKPNKQTILPLKSIPTLYDTLPIKKVKGLGGKLGENLCEILKVKCMSELVNFTEQALQRHLDERTGSWLYLMARGIDLEAVTPRYNSKSIGCCKRFPGKNAITGLATLTHWLTELAKEIIERLEKDLVENNRTAKQMTVSYAQQFEAEDVSSTRSIPLVAYDEERMVKDALDAIKRHTEQFLKGEGSQVLNNPVKFLGISVGKFEDNPDASKKNKIKEMFSNMSKKPVVREVENMAKEEKPEEKPEKRDIQSLFKNHSKSEKAVPSEETNIEGSPLKLPQNSFFKKYLNSKSATITKPVPTEPTKDEKENVSECMSENNLDVNEELDLENPETPDPQNIVEDENKPNTYNDDTLEEAPVEMTNSNLTKNVEKAREPSNPNADYTKTYAEFYRLPVFIKPVYKNCPECDKNVVENELQSHLDFHLALKLSQQQRDEFRNEIKSKVPSPSNNNSGNKTKNVKPAVRNPINKFFTRPQQNEPVPSTSCAIQEATEKCSDCEKRIPISKLTEHTDYHTAKRLQIEFNRSDMLTVVSNNLASTSSNKRKRPSTPTANAKMNSVKINSVSTYFTKH